MAVSIQHGIISATGTQATDTITEVVLSRSILLVSVTSDGSGPDDNACGARFANSTTVEFNFGATQGNGREVAYWVIEFGASDGVSVQHGSHTMASADEDITISAVSMSETFCLINFSNDYDDWNSGASLAYELTSTTNLKLRTQEDANHGTVYYQIVSASGARVQRGSFTGWTDGQETDTIAEVVLENTFLLSSILCGDSDSKEAAIGGRLLNSTTLQFDRADPTSTSADVYWEVVEWTALTVQQVIYSGDDGDNATIDITISAVDLSKAAVLGSNRSQVFAYNNTEINGWRSFFVTTELTSTTNLQLTRIESNSGYTGIYYVIEFDPSDAYLVRQKKTNFAFSDNGDLSATLDVARAPGNTVVAVVYSGAPDEHLLTSTGFRFAGYGGGSSAGRPEVSVFYAHTDDMDSDTITMHWPTTVDNIGIAVYEVIGELEVEDTDRNDSGDSLVSSLNVGDIVAAGDAFGIAAVGGEAAFSSTGAGDNAFSDGFTENEIFNERMVVATQTVSGGLTATDVTLTLDAGTNQLAGACVFFKAYEGAPTVATLEASDDAQAHGSTSAQLIVSVPTDAGNLLLMYSAERSGSTAISSPTDATDNGYTEVFTDAVLPGDGTFRRSHFLYGKEAEGGSTADVIGDTAWAGGATAHWWYGEWSVPSGYVLDYDNITYVTGDNGAQNDATTVETDDSAELDGEYLVVGFAMWKEDPADPSAAISTFHPFTVGDSAVYATTDGGNYGRYIEVWHDTMRFAGQVIHGTYQFEDATPENAGLLIALAFIPIVAEGGGAATYEQEGFRWRNDDGSESAATWRAAQDTNTGVAVIEGETVRLRTLINVTNDPASQSVKLQYRKVGDSEWLDVE